LQIDKIAIITQTAGIKDRTRTNFIPFAFRHAWFGGPLPQRLPRSTPNIYRIKLLYNKRI
jgi:hypothetical protein